MSSFDPAHASDRLERLRRLPLSGAINFRDLGGYAAAEGRCVRWGQLYRSDSLSEVTDADLQAIQGLGLRSLFDLRHAHERGLRPNRLGRDADLRVHEIGFYPQGVEGLLEKVRTRAITAPEARSALQDIYWQLPVEQVAVYSTLIHALLEPQALPALIHCTSGKDRTGFAAAVLLMALGVSRETIVQDYALTNDYRRDIRFMVGSNADPGVMDAVTAASPEYLAAAFRSIDVHWGSDQAFLQVGLGLTSERHRHLQSLLLEPAGDASGGGWSW